LFIVTEVIPTLMNKDQEIQDIVNQLERLQIQQSDLLQRLGLLSERDDSNNTAIPICNRRQGTNQEPSTVEARNGTKIVRAPKNLILES
jgi:hypothetical protein